MIEAKVALQIVLDKFQEDNPATIESIGQDISKAAQKGQTSVDIQIIGAPFARALNRYLTSKGYSVFFPPMASEHELVTLIVKW